MKVKSRSLLHRLTVGIFLGYPLWCWVFSQTIFKNDMVNYLFFVLTAVLFALILFKHSGGWLIDKSTKIWLPSLFYILFLASIGFFAEMIAWWFCCIALLLISVKYKITELIPIKVFVFCGVFAIVGIGVQLLYPSFHSAYVYPLFIKGDTLQSWAEGYGLAGFTYQLAITAFYLLYFEAVWLYIYGRKHKPSYFWIVLVLIILSVFLTGKRTLSLISVIVPLFVFLLSQHSFFKILVLGSLIMLVSILVFDIFISNYAEYTDNIFLRRFSDTVDAMQMGGDIESQRGELRELAIKAWNEHPIFGIGLGNYRDYTHAYTDAHNAYLQVLCEQGIIGFVLWVVPLFMCLLYTFEALKRCPRKSDEKKWLQFSLCLQLQFVIYAFTGNPMSNIDRFITYFFAIAILSETDYKLTHRQNLRQVFGNRKK